MLARAPAGVLCAGNLVCDILVRPVNRFTWNTTVWVESIEQALGGNGANTAYALGVLGVPVRLLSTAGSDPFADDLLGRLSGAGVDVRRIVRSPVPTAATVALVNSNGDRMFCHRKGASAEAFAEPVEFCPALLEGMSHFHLANPFALPHMRRHAPENLRRARAAGLTVSLDTGWDAEGRWLEDIGPCLRHADLLFANEDEALRLSGETGWLRAGRRLLELGARGVVLKLGALGCVVITPDSHFRSPAFDVPPVDTTGAGDCFAGAFLAALHRGRSPEEAARFANGVAALSIQKLGATAGLRPYAEAEAWITQAPVRAE
jgi:sugar/nucleoside kinase (ribokinase family)